MGNGKIKVIVATLPFRSVVKQAGEMHTQRNNHSTSARLFWPVGEGEQTSRFLTGLSRF